MAGLWKPLSATLTESWRASAQRHGDGRTTAARASPAKLAGRGVSGPASDVRTCGRPVLPPFGAGPTRMAPRRFVGPLFADDAARAASRREPGRRRHRLPSARPYGGNRLAPRATGEPR